MQIALDTNALYTSTAGVARYIRGLQRGLAEIESPNTYHEFAWPVYNLGYKQPNRAFKTFYRELIWARFGAPRFLQSNKIDLLHTTGTSFVECPANIRHVVTLHDLAAIRHPERFRQWQRYSTKHRFSRAIRADRVLCISRFTADEAIQLINLSPSKIDVVYNGGDFHPETCPQEKVPDFLVPSEFYLFVGSLEPGKNLSLIKEAYQLAATQKKTLPPLLIIGARWEGVSSEGPAPQGWAYLGRQPDEVLVYLYRRALGLVYPSKYEGFGLPLVEAMALGCPVICSPVASLPEVGGDAPLFTDLTPDAYYRAMSRLQKDSDFRFEMISKGYLQSKKFTWHNCAAETSEVYERAFK